MNRAPALHQRAHLTASASVDATGQFEILAITAGEGNGWMFSEACLRDSLALWDGAECFVDHRGGGRSVRDLAGVLSDPRWDAGSQGIRCKLNVLGPSGPLLEELGRQLLAEPGMMLDSAPAVAGGSTAAGGTAISGGPASSGTTVADGAAATNGPGSARRVPVRKARIGFSADVIFSVQGQAVQKIVRVMSVDLVFNPARGGAFVRALNSIHGGALMIDDGSQPGNFSAQDSQTPQNSASAQLAETLQATQSLITAQQIQQARQVRVQMCGYLLDTALTGSKLPGPAAEMVRKQFSNKAFEPAELDKAITDARQLVSELSGAGVVQGAGRISGMFSSEDQFSAAVHDLIGVDRPDDQKAIKAAKLSGIRELYMLMTGDREFVGGYNAERAQFATTADLPGVLKNAMNKAIIVQWQELGRSGYRWWEPIVSVEHFTNLQSLTGVLVGEVTLLPTVAEGGAYTSLNVKDSPETASWVKYGGYIGLTLEMFERDETHKLRQFPRKLASAGLRRVSALVADVFLANAGAGPVMTDAVNVFAAGHNNLGVAALASATWEAASSAIYNQPMLVGAGGTAPKQAIDAKYLLVPRALRLTGMQLLYPNIEHTANMYSENMQKGQMGDVITCPEFTDVSDWAAVADPRIAPAIVLAERFGVMPEIILADQEKHGALFTNDEIRLKARHWLAVVVADHRPLYKANVP